MIDVIGRRLANTSSGSSIGSSTARPTACPSRQPRLAFHPSWYSPFATPPEIWQCRPPPLQDLFAVWHGLIPQCVRIARVHCRRPTRLPGLVVFDPVLRLLFFFLPLRLGRRHPRRLRLLLRRLPLLFWQSSGAEGGGGEVRSRVVQKEDEVRCGGKIGCGVTVGTPYPPSELGENNAEIV